MNKFNLVSILSSAALAFALASPATATTMTNGGNVVVGQGLMSYEVGAVTTTFNGSSTLPVGFAANGTTPSNAVVRGNSQNLFAAPMHDFSNYLTTGTGSITDTLAPGTDYLGLYWGSVDSYNTISLTESDDTVVTLSGSDVAASLGLISDGTTSYFVNFFSDPGTTFTSASFSSTQNSFEFDNVATASPEPGTIAMLAGGLLVVAGSLRRRKA